MYLYYKKRKINKMDRIDEEKIYIEKNNYQKYNEYNQINIIEKIYDLYLKFIKIFSNKY